MNALCETQGVFLCAKNGQQGRGVLRKSVKSCSSRLKNFSEDDMSFECSGFAGDDGFRLRKNLYAVKNVGSQKRQQFRILQKRWHFIFYVLKA